MHNAGIHAAYSGYNSPITSLLFGGSYELCFDYGWRCRDQALAS